MQADSSIPVIESRSKVVGTTFCLANSERKELLPKNYYFDNETVEFLMHQYLRGACTSVQLRDEIMKHASELIKQIIKAHNLGQIYPGKEESSIMDLFQTAWIQIESALYKYGALPHCKKCFNAMRPMDSLLYPEYVFEDFIIKKIKICRRCNNLIAIVGIHYRGKSRVFNMWSQIARTVILAYIKKENRDRKNSDVFKSHLEHKTIPYNETLQRFFSEAEAMSRYNDDHLKILAELQKLYSEDDRAHEGLITKLVLKTKLSRSVVTDFFRILRSRSHEITDSPVNREVKSMKSLMDTKNTVDEGE
jgi:hypothetical protein